MAATKPNALPWLGASLLVLVLDQWSKAWVLSSLPEYTAVPVIEGFWNWYRTYNTGAAFSFLANAGGWQKWFFVVLAFAISGLMAWMLSRTPRNDWKPECISLAAARVRARKAGSAGHSFASGNFSARYSQIASESHTVKSPSFKAGTNPDGECGNMAASVRPSS